MNVLRVSWEDIKAIWRGERRVAPRACHGRVYVRRADDPGGMSGKTRPKGSISARVYRAETGTWEDLGVIAKQEEG